jgi:hypothetical protein
MKEQGMQKQAVFLDLIKRVSTHEQALLASLGEEEKARLGTPERWTAKDLIAHCAEWRERLGFKLAAIARGETPVEDGDYDHANREIYERYRHETWDVVLEKAASSTDTILAWLESWGERLDETGLFPGQPKRAVWREIAGTGYIHPMQHLIEHAAERGDALVVKQLNLEMAARLANLDEGAEWQGFLQYNLACYYSLSGDAPQAYEILRAALQLRPDLVDFAPRDQDFEELWEKTEFKAIIAEAQGREESGVG